MSSAPWPASPSSYLFFTERGRSWRVELEGNLSSLLAGSRAPVVGGRPGTAECRGAAWQSRQGGRERRSVPVVRASRRRMPAAMVPSSACARRSRLHRAGGLARRRRAVQQRRPDARRVDRVLRAAVAVSVSAAGPLDPRLGHRGPDRSRRGRALRLPLFPAAVRLHDRAARRVSRADAAARRRRPAGADVGVARRVQRHFRRRSITRGASSAAAAS